MLLRSTTSHTQRVSLWLSCVVLCLGLIAPAFGQSATNSPPAAPKGNPQFIPSFASMQQAVLSQDYTLEQWRRFKDENGNIVTVRELLEVDANGSNRPDFQLTFQAVEGEPAGSALTMEWQQTYDRYGTLFFRQGAFNIRDLSKASAHYSLHDFGIVVRAGRIARRMVVFPNAVDKAIWVIDVDSLTSVPLFIAEFDHSLNLFANIEAIQFTPSVQTITPTVPATSVTPMLDYATAQTHLGSPAGLIDPNVMVAIDYTLENIDVHDDPINGRQKLVMSYTDGIDQFMIVQTVNTADPFATLPSSAGGAHTIGRFRDPAISALVFWDDQVAFHIAGRGQLKRLDEVARRVYLQALSN